MDGVRTCELMIEFYNDVRKPRDSDDPERAALRERIFVPQMICCSAYDESRIWTKVSASGMSHILSKPPEILQFKHVLK